MKKTIAFFLMALLGLAAQVWTQTPKPLRTLVSPFPISSGNFGASIAVIGNNIIVGAPHDTVQGISVGAAYLFDGATGQLLRIFKNPIPNDNPIPGPDEQFGFAVAAFGNNILIGEPFNNIPGSLSVGRVHLYDGATGALVRTFFDNVSFGYAIATIDSNVIIGSPDEDVGGITEAGAVHVFNGNTGQRLRTIPNPEPGEFDSFGSSLAVVGNNVVIGAPSDGDSQVADAGAAYLFDINTGQLLQTFKNQPRIGGAALGSAVGALGNNVLLGAPFETIENNSRAGAVYLFDTGSGSVLKKFTDSDPTSEAFFGSSVAAFDNHVLVGAPGGGTQVTVGSAYLVNSATGDIIQTFRDPQNNRNAKFGATVATLGRSVVIGAPNDSKLASDAGAVYFFSAAPLCSLAVTSPRNGLTLTGQSTLITGNIFVNGGIPPLDTLLTVNGIRAPFNLGQFIAPAQLAFGANDLVVRLRIKDSQGDSAVCSDTLRVTRAPGDAKTCVDFESLIFRTQFGGQFGQQSGDVIFAENNVSISVHGFKETPTGSTFFISCRVDSTFSGFGDGQIMRANNINLKFDFTRLSTPVNQVTFEFLDQGGSENIAVNDGTVFIGDLPDAPTNISPGVTLKVDTVQVGGDDFGKVTLVGPINNLLLGGQEFWIDNICAQDTFSCQLVIKSPLPNAIICSDSVTVRATARILGGVPPFSIEYEVNGIKATFADTNLTVKVPLSLGANNLIATSTTTDGSGKSAICTDSVRVSRIAILRDLVVNEILSDPNDDDLGAEKIEVKNIGATPVLLDSTLALWIRRGDLDTYWTFRRNRVTLDPNQFFVIHWLGQGRDDEGNIFTGLPRDGGNRGNAQDGFWGNNSAAANNMTIGGADSSNKEAFAIALVQQIFPGDEKGFNDPCKVVDFVQICGRVVKSETLAVEAGLWRAGDFLTCAPEGNSEARQNNGQFEQNPKSSFGSDNVPASTLPAKHLLISEVCVRPDDGEFVEIYNPSDSTINLRDYYLTDNVNGADDAAYTRLVKGADSLQIQAGDFFVQFPANARIGPRQFQTVAFSASRFLARYKVKPTYEIRNDDPAVANMDTLTPGSGNAGLDDSDEALVLLKWVKNNSSDLVQDVDYVVWGEPITITKTGLAPIKAIGEAWETTAVAAVKAPDLGINKTGVGIDGADGNNARSYYNNETRVANQRPIANAAHAVFKSWQRVTFVEVGEKTAGGNGISGHDETSENLAASFKEAAPTPTGPLDDLVQNRPETFSTILDNPRDDPRLKAKGFPNKLINPGEVVSVKIALQNNNDKPTGAFFGILRPLDPVVITIDSTANFPSIAGNGATGFSLTPYVLKVDDIILPDTLRFNLVMIQKFSPPKQTKSDNVHSLNAVTVRVIFIVLPTVNISFDIAYSLPLQSTSKPDSNLMRFAYTLIAVPPASGFPAGGYNATEMTVSVNTQNLNNSLFAGAVPQVPKPFTLGSSFPMVTPDALLLNLAQTFRDSLPSSFDLVISWNEPCTGCGSYPNVPANKRPIKGGVTITSALLDSLTITGEIIYYANGVDEDSQPVPQAIPNVNIFVKSPKATRFPMTTTIKTNSEGIFSFKIGKSDTGAYRIYATLSTPIPADVIGQSDSKQAVLLKGPPQFPTKNDQVFKRLAADAHRDGIINDCDVKVILNQPLSGCDPTKVRRGLWTFVDAALTSVTNGTFSSAKDTLDFRVKNYGRQANFVGIVYGDADGCLGTFFPTECAEIGSTPNRNLAAVQRSRQDVPREFFLSQNYPNPFNPTTRIEYGLPTKERVSLQIFNVVGQLVYTCVDQSQPAGYYEANWDGRNQDGKPAPAGVYLMRLQAGAYSQVRKLALVK